MTCNLQNHGRPTETSIPLWALIAIGVWDNGAWRWAENWGDGKSDGVTHWRIVSSVKCDCNPGRAVLTWSNALTPDGGRQWTTRDWDPDTPQLTLESETAAALSKPAQSPDGITEAVIDELRAAIIGEPPPTSDRSP